MIAYLRWRGFQGDEKVRLNIGRSIGKNFEFGWIGVYTKETSAILNVPFQAFHCLDEDEEIKFFDIINTKAKGIGTSLSRFLKELKKSILLYKMYITFFCY